MMQDRVEMAQCKEKRPAIEPAENHGSVEHAAISQETVSFEPPECPSQFIDLLVGVGVEMGEFAGDGHEESYNFAFL
jgi:hypothetical protein